MDETALKDILKRLGDLENRLAACENALGISSDVVDFSDFQEDVSMPAVIDYVPDSEPADVAVKEAALALDDRPVEDDIPAVEEFPVMNDIPADDSGLLFAGYDAPRPSKPVRKKSIHDAAAENKTTSVADLLSDSRPWLHDMPGPEVKSLRSAITLGDQVLFIRRLFRDDSALYTDTIARLDGMKTFKEALEYIVSSFPEWDMSSEDVYRFLMALRRKIRTV